MPIVPLLAAYLIVTGLSLEGLALLLSLLDRSPPQMRFVVVVMVGVGVVSLAYALRGRRTRLGRQRVKHSRVYLLKGRR